MTQIRQVLVHVNDSPRSREVVQLAAALAAAHGAAIAALHAVDPLAVGAYLTPEAANIAAELARDAEQARRERAIALVAGVAQVAGIELPFERAEGDALSALLQRARCTDLLVLGQHDPGQPDGTASTLAPRLLMGAGCPLLFVPYAMGNGGATPHCGERVLVAWSDRRESARALRDALPLLQRAQQVELVRFTRETKAGGEPLDEVAAHLRRHGVHAECTVHRSREPTVAERLLPRWTPDAPVAEALLSHAADTGADLIVMGGYGHPRAWELVLGGVTRTLLQSMTVPVLMSH